MQALPGWAVIKPEEKKKEGELFLPETVKTELQRGIVVEINPTYLKDGIQVSLKIKKGDRVVFKKYYDNDLDIDGEKYKLVHLDNIQVILN